MNHTVIQLGKFSRIPAVGSAYEVACDALELVDMRASAFRTYLQRVGGILVTAAHAAVAVVVYRAVAYVVLVYQVNNVSYRLRIVGGIAVNLYIEYVAAAGQFVVWCLYFGLVLG